MLFNSIRNIIAGYPVDFQSIIAQIFSVIFIIFLILPLHEFAHAKIASKLGDPTPRWDKRLTLNPIASIDPIGALALLLFGYGWAKPVQVDPRYFKNPKKGMAIVALAGPVSNFLAALVGGFIFCAVMAFAPFNQISIFVYEFLQSYIVINIVIAVFNLIPIPPLDGSRIVGAFMSDRTLYNYYKYQNYFYMIFFVLMFSGFLDRPLGIAQNFFYSIIMNISKFPFELFGVL